MMPMSNPPAHHPWRDQATKDFADLVTDSIEATPHDAADTALLVHDIVLAAIHTYEDPLKERIGALTTQLIAARNVTIVEEGL